MKPRFKSGPCGGTQSYTGRSWSVMVGAAVHSGAIQVIRIVIVGGWYLGRSYKVHGKVIAALEVPTSVDS